MRIASAAVAALLLPTGALASPVGVSPGFFPSVQITMDGASFGLLLPAVGGDGKFAGSSDVVLCDASVREGRECGGTEVLGARLSFAISGSIFPQIVANLSFLDAGAPTALTVTFVTSIPVISGTATTSLQGSLEVPADRTAPSVTSPLESGAFIEGFVAPSGGSPTTIADVGVGSVTLGEMPKTESWGPIAGTYDCGPIGGCELIGLGMGLNGLGGGTQYKLSGTFDVDPAALAPIPLPASLALLGAGVGLLGVTARRRRR